MGRDHVHAIICADLDLTIAIKLQSQKENSDSWNQDLFSHLPTVLLCAALSHLALLLHFLYVGILQ